MALIYRDDISVLFIDSQSELKVNINVLNPVSFVITSWNESFRVTIITHSEILLYKFEIGTEIRNNNHR
jgi:hypothetical protein